MSGSPKYNTFRLQTEQEQRIQAERAARAVEEEARRQQEIEIRRAERLRAAKQSVTRQTLLVEQRIKDIPVHVRSFIPGEIADFRGQIKVLSGILEASETEADMRQIESRIRAVELEVIRAASRAFAFYERQRALREGVERQQDFARFGREIQSVERRLNTLGVSDSSRFDSAGLSKVQIELVRVREAIARQEGGLVKSFAKQLEEALVNHEQAVMCARERWRIAFAEASSFLSQADDALTGLNTDPIVRLWCRESADDIMKRMVDARAALSQDQFEQVHSLSGDILKRVEEITAEAQAIQLCEERRQYVVQSLCEILSAQGFLLKNGSPTLDYPDQPGSALMIEARRITGETLAISVPQDLSERIEYDVAGYERLRSRTEGGKDATSCDAAEAALDEARMTLKERFGIESSPLDWEGKDPRKIRKGAKDLPGGQDNKREFGTSA